MTKIPFRSDRKTAKAKADPWLLAMDDNQKARVAERQVQAKGGVPVALGAAVGPIEVIEKAPGVVGADVCWGVDGVEEWIGMP